MILDEIQIGDKFKDTSPLFEPFKTIYIPEVDENGQPVLDENDQPKFKMKKIAREIPNRKIVEVTAKTTNSIELAHQARTEDGIDCKQWYILSGDFFKRFTKQQ